MSKNYRDLKKRKKGKKGKEKRKKNGEKRKNEKEKLPVFWCYLGIIKNKREQRHYKE